MPRSCRLVLLLAGLCACVSGCPQQSDPWNDPGTAGKSPRLLISFAPIYCFVKNVADDDAATKMLLPPTVGPHDFQPTVKEMLLARRADMFFINGLNIDDKFASDIRRHSGNPDLKVVELGESVGTLIPLAHEKKGEMHEGHVHEGEHDPHVWLGIPEAIHMVNEVRNKLKESNRDKAKAYDKNADEYVKQLKELHTWGKSALSAVKPENRKIIAFHDSLRYFARSFDLQIVGVIEARPGQPPSAAEFKQLVDLCKKEKVRVIAVEPQYPDDVAKRLLENIAKEGVTGVKIVVIDPLETALPDDFSAEHQEGKDLYVRKIKQNIANLVKEFP